MGRPRKGQNVAAEKELTFAICSQIKASSGLSFAQLEQTFAIGDRSGRVFARYCDKSPSRRQMTTRDNLHKWLTISCEKNWIAKDFAAQYAKWVSSPGHPSPSEIAVKRRELEAGIAESINAAAQALYKVWELVNLHRNECQLVDIKDDFKDWSSESEGYYPGAGPEALLKSWSYGLKEHLGSKRDMLGTLASPGRANLQAQFDSFDPNKSLNLPELLLCCDWLARQRIQWRYSDFEQTSPKNFIAKPREQKAETQESPVSDVDELMAEIEASLLASMQPKSGAKVVQLRAKTKEIRSNATFD